MSFMLILVIAAFIVLIAALTLGRGWRELDRANRLVDYWMGLLVLTALCFLPVFLLIWGVDSYVIPIRMASEAFGRYDPDPAEWEDNIEDEKEGNIPDKHADKLRKQGVPEYAIRVIQDSLWRGWPIIVGAGLLFLFAGIGALAQCNREILKEVEANDSCPPGGADSYVGVRTLDSPREYQTDVLSGEECEARSHSRRQRGNRSSREIHQRDSLYERIAVASDDIARDILSSIDERGPAYVIERIAEDLHEPGHHEIGESPSGGPKHDDEAYEERGYILIWNARRRYVSLAFAVEPGARGTS